MDTNEAMAEMNVSDSELSAEQFREFDVNGFVVLPNVFTAEQCRTAAAAFDEFQKLEGERGGIEVHTEAGAPRLSNVFNKTAAFDCVLRAKPLISLAHRTLGEFKVHGANVREPAPGHSAQGLHVDCGKRWADDWQLVNSLVLFDDMSLENGPTRVVPGSHRWSVIPSPNKPYGEETSEAERKKVPTDPLAPYPGEVIVTAKAGSVVAFNGVLWHSGTQNKSGGRRRVLSFTYARRELSQQLDQRKYLTSALYDRLTPAMRYFLDVEKAPEQASA